MRLKVQRPSCSVVTLYSVYRQLSKDYYVIITRYEMPGVITEHR